jgi:hypothetical protein
MIHRFDEQGIGGIIIYSIKYVQKSKEKRYRQENNKKLYIQQ